MTDPAVLRTLVPINSLAAAHFQELAEAVTFEKKSKGLVLFKLGATDNETFYVLEGQVELIAEGGHEGRVITGGTEQGRYPLAQLKPRQFTGKTKTDVVIARVPSDLLDRLLTWDQVTGEYEVTELAGAEDAEWTMQVLRNRAFQLLPASNINQLFERLEPVALKAGEIVIEQGGIGDYFYIIKEGRCRVSRKAERSGQLAVLGELSDGDSFGEEALLSGAPRNAAIVMATDGVVMRLSKRDFEELLQRPLVRWVIAPEVKTMVKNGAGLVDVRLEDEHRHSAIKGSTNIPLYLLRLKAGSLDPERSYVLYCETGNRSSAAAFLLSERGFDVYVLEGGLAALRAARRESTSTA
jgi:CRP-like cAMP-binding protein